MRPSITDHTMERRGFAESIAVYEERGRGGERARGGGWGFVYRLVPIGIA